MTRTPGPLVPSVAETLKHPAFPTAIWNLEPDRKGLVPVAKGRGGPINISWEIHGSGPVKLVLIMGLGALKSAWQRQTLHFGHEQHTRYSVLLIDNRGMGDSDKPLMRYSTSEMALDIAEVLAHPSVAWLPSFPFPTTPPPQRTLHILGISLGGMVAQELACLIPSTISSLSLICTAPYIENTTTFAENMAQRASMLLPKTVDRSVGDAARSMFSHAWLREADTTHLPNPSTTPGVLPPTEGGEYMHFETNAERFVAGEMHKRLDRSRFGIKGFLLQLIAAGWHHKSRAQLEAMAEQVGRERILVMHGTQDRMISLPHGEKLIEFLRPGRAVVVEEMGHAPIVERCEWFNGVVEEMMGVGEELDGRG